MQHTIDFHRSADQPVAGHVGVGLVPVVPACGHLVGDVRLHRHDAALVVGAAALRLRVPVDIVGHLHLGPDVVVRPYIWFLQPWRGLAADVRGDRQVPSVPAWTIRQRADLGLDLLTRHLAGLGCEPLALLDGLVCVHEQREQLARVLGVRAEQLIRLGCLCGLRSFLESARGYDRLIFFFSQFTLHLFNRSTIGHLAYWPKRRQRLPLRRHRQDVAAGRLLLGRRDVRRLQAGRLARGHPWLVPGQRRWHTRHARARAAWGHSRHSWHGRATKASRHRLRELLPRHLGLKVNATRGQADAVPRARRDVLLDLHVRRLVRADVPDVGALLGQRGVRQHFVHGDVATLGVTPDRAQLGVVIVHDVQVPIIDHLMRS